MTGEGNCVPMVQKVRAGGTASNDNEWQLIAECRAPTHELILLCDGRMILTGKYTYVGGDWICRTASGPTYYACGKWFASDCQVDGNFQPTHWRKLPDPPEPTT